MERLTGTQKYIPLTVAGMSWDLMSSVVDLRLEPAVTASKTPTKQKNMVSSIGLHTSCTGGSGQQGDVKKGHVFQLRFKFNSKEKLTELSTRRNLVGAQLHKDGGDAHVGAEYFIQKVQPV